MAAPPITERHRHHFHRRSPILESVRVATTANVTVSTALNNGDTLDGVTLATGDRVLVKDQSTGSQNGIWVVGTTPVRAYDLATDEPNFGFLVYVREGTANGGKTYRNTNTSEPTVGSTSVTFAALIGTVTLAFDDLSDVTITTPAAGDRPRYDGSGWVNSSLRWEPLFDGLGSAVLDGLGNPVMQEVAG